MLTDTQPEAEAVLIELLRQAPPWRKLAQVGQMNVTVRLLLIQGLCQRHPDADESEIRRRLAALLLGQEVAEVVYGPLPVEMDNG
jgi:hypothetical protein